jgi:hypothetical protein
MRRGSAFKLILAALCGCLMLLAVFVATRAPTGQGTARFVGAYEWHAPGGAEVPDWFGGFSALDVTGQGTAMMVLTDKAQLAQVTITRETGAAITGITVSDVQPLLSSRGVPLTGRIRDSEGLARGRNGDIYVSFEGVTRVARYEQPDTFAHVLPRPPAFVRIVGNKSLEALAIDHNGHLYTLPERAPDESGDIPVFKWNGGAWQTPFSLPTRGRFLPVAADIGPDGMFYLLERDFSVLGFRSRLRRWSIASGQPQDETLLLQTGPGIHDNLEGLSVWRDRQGALRATMISDDNFNRLQRTEIVEYALPD